MITPSTTAPVPAPRGDAGTHGQELRVLVLAPTGRVALRIGEALEREEVPGEISPDLGTLCRLMEEGAGMAILAEEALPPAAERFLADVLSRQPPWSDFPLIILTHPGTTSRVSQRLHNILGTLENVLFLERPVGVPTLISAVRTSLRDRARQYEIREQVAAIEEFAALLRETDRRKNEFLAMLGHELRNPHGWRRTG
jgi:signal transduction histidine kinase